MGTILLIIGVIAVVTFGRKLLPSHPSVLDTDAVADQQQLAQAYDLDDDLYRLLVPVTSTLVGKTIADSHLGSDYDVTVLKIMRKPQPETANRLRCVLKTRFTINPFWLLPKHTSGLTIHSSFGVIAST